MTVVTPRRFLNEEMRRKRTDAALTQAGIADKLGIGQTAVSQWETGRVRPSNANLEKLAGLLGCRPADLMGAP